MKVLNSVKIIRIKKEKKEKKNYTRRFYNRATI